MPKMILYHGTNKKLKYLREETFLTINPLEASHFAQIKNGDVVCVVDVVDEEVYRDTGTPQAEWYLTK